MASRLTLLRNLTFRRNLRLLCTQVRRSLYQKVSLPWFFEMTTYFLQSRPSLARTRSILPHASFQLNAISFDKVTSRVLILFQYFIIVIFLRISVFPIPFNLAEDGKPRTGFAISTNNLRFEHSSISWTLIKSFCYLDLCGDLVLIYFCFYSYQSSTIWRSICINLPPSQWHIFIKTRKSL